MTPRKRRKSTNFHTEVSESIERISIAGSTSSACCTCYIIITCTFSISNYCWVQTESLCLHVAVTPPMKNVRKRRFRKTLKKKVSCAHNSTHIRYVVCMRWKFKHLLLPNTGSWPNVTQLSNGSLNKSHSFSHSTLVDILLSLVDSATEPCAGAHWLMLCKMSIADG